jgi:hypothetical protein
LNGDNRGDVSDWIFLATFRPKRRAPFFLWIKTAPALEPARLCMIAAAADENSEGIISAVLLHLAQNPLMTRFRLKISKPAVVNQIIIAPYTTHVYRGKEPAAVL